MIKWPLISRKVVGHSMEPELNAGESVLASPLLSAGKGDVVIARVEGRDMIKRVGQVTDKYVLLVGDNPADSHDSRVYGEVSKRNILGKVFYVDKQQG